MTANTSKLSLFLQGFLLRLAFGLLGLGVFYIVQTFYPPWDNWPAVFSFALPFYLAICILGGVLDAARGYRPAIDWGPGHYKAWGVSALMVIIAVVAFLRLPS